MAQAPLLKDGEEEELIPIKDELLDMGKMAFQISLTQIVRQVLTITDAAFLGHLGTNQLAAVSLAGMWQGVPSTFIQFSIQAVTTLSSQARGAGNNKLCGEWLQTALAWALLGTIPVFLVYCCVGRLVALTMDDVEVQEYAQQFSMVMALALPAQFIYSALTSYFSTLGVVAPASMCTACTMFMNIAFNKLFIYGCGSWEGFGFVGSPLATVTSSWLQLILYSIYCLKIKKYHQGYWGGWTKKAFTRDRFKIFLGLGVPAGASSVVDWASAAIAGAISGLLGPYIAASQNVLGGLFSITYSAVSGFAAATQIRLARYLGEGKPKAAERMFILGSTMLTVGGVCTSVLVFFAHDALWRIWTPDEGLVEACNTALYSFIACVMAAYVRFTLSAVMSSLSSYEANINLVANNIASWLIYVPLSYYLPIILKMGVNGFWWADFAGEAFKVVVLAWGVSRVDWTSAAAEARAKAKDCEQLEESLARSRAQSLCTPPSSHTGTITRAL